METIAEITVHFEHPFAERLAQLARLSGKSVAEVVELYIKVQLGWRPVANSTSPEVRALKGSLPLLQNASYKDVTAEEVLRKYGA